MNILFIAHYVDLYGANRSMLTLIKEFQRAHDLNCHVVVPRTGPLTLELDQLQVSYTICDIPWWFMRRHELVLDGTWQNGRMRSFLRWLRREWIAMNVIARIVKVRSIDLVHTNTAVVATGLFAARRAGVPHIWHLREFATLDYDLHPVLGMSLIRKIMARSDGVIAVSNAIRTYFRIPRGAHCRVIHNGVVPAVSIADPALVSLEPTLPFIFCIVGVISHSKGHPEAIKAMALVLQRHPDTRLRVIGDGALEEMKVLAGELGIARNILFEGFLKDVQPVLKGSHALLMCSRNEGMGRVTAEAMAAGLPVVGHDSGGTSELIENEVDGLLYSGSHIELADRMCALIEDQELYKRLSRNALKKAASSFTIENYVLSVRKFYDEVLSARK